MQLNDLTNLLISFPNKYTLLSRRLPTFLGYRVVRPLSVGMFLLGTHYRAPINYIVERLRMCLVGDPDCMGWGQPYFAGPPHSSECLVVWLERIEFRDWFREWE
jgi:hypothetical protein